MEIILLVCVLQTRTLICSAPVCVDPCAAPSGFEGDRIHLHTGAEGGRGGGGWGARGFRAASEEHLCCEADEWSSGETNNLHCTSRAVAHQRRFPVLGQLNRWCISKLTQRPDLNSHAPIQHAMDPTLCFSPKAAARTGAQGSGVGESKDTGGNQPLTPWPPSLCCFNENFILRWWLLCTNQTANTYLLTLFPKSESVHSVGFAPGSAPDPRCSPPLLTAVSRRQRVGRYLRSVWTGNCALRFSRTAARVYHFRSTVVLKPWAKASGVGICCLENNGSEVGSISSRFSVD